MQFLRFNILERYLFKQFFSVLVLCLLAATGLFLVFDIFERMRIFVREDASFIQASSYILLKVPFILQLMTPVAVLIAVLISVGRLSQSSEITAMRACGMSVIALARPLIVFSVLLSATMLLFGETIVPWSTERAEEIYNLEIRKKHLKNGSNREDFWLRKGSKFLQVGLYNSGEKRLERISIYELDRNFKLSKRTDSSYATWNENPLIRWTMHDVSEKGQDDKQRYHVSKFSSLPLLLEESPADFRNVQRNTESMTYRELKSYSEKLESDGAQITPLLVDLASKISFPLVNCVVILVAFPFALLPARSGAMTKSFISGVSIGFAYYLVHAISRSLGNAELLPILPAAWAANILFISLGVWLMARAEFNS